MPWAPAGGAGGQVVSQAPLLEFCYWTSPLSPAGPRGQFLPVNKVTVLARTLQLSFLPNPWHEQYPQQQQQGPGGVARRGGKPWGPMSSKPPTPTWLTGPVGKGKGRLLPGPHPAPGNGDAAGRLRLRHIYSRGQRQGWGSQGCIRILQCPPHLVHNLQATEPPFWMAQTYKPASVLA